MLFSNVEWGRDERSRGFDIKQQANSDDRDRSDEKSDWNASEGVGGDSQSGAVSSIWGVCFLENSSWVEF